jgi:hypothetical protein
MKLQAIAERELRDALVRYLARLRGTDATVGEMLDGWKAACLDDLKVVVITQNGLAQHGTPKRLAGALGFDSDTLGERAKVEIDRAAAMLELTCPTERR